MGAKSDPVIVVLGPTAAGKSNLALALARSVGGEIVNCDSVQLYRHLNIGTAKTPADQREGIPHHLLDILDPDQHFSAGDYARLARPLLGEIWSRGRIPIVVGGTGFYLRALFEGLSPGPPRDEQLRRKLNERDPGLLHRLLKRWDSVTAARIHPNDRQKLIRALEVCLLTRSPMASHFERHASQPLEGVIVHRIGLDPPARELAACINARCERMFTEGLVEEVRRILSLGYSPSAKALESIGYREALLHLSGELTLQEALARTQAATRQYAKRQRTWFRREQDVFSIPELGGDRSFALSLQYLRDKGVL